MGYNILRTAHMLELILGYKQEPLLIAKILYFQIACIPIDCYLYFKITIIIYCTLISSFGQLLVYVYILRMYLYTLW